MTTEFTDASRLLQIVRLWELYLLKLTLVNYIIEVSVN